MSNPRTTKPRGPVNRPRRPRKQLLVFYGVLICAGVALLIAGRGALVQHDEATPGDDLSPRQRSVPNENIATAPKHQRSKQTLSPDEPIVLIDDDRQTLWASPTDGPPLDVAYLSPGAQIIVALRPAAILQHAEGEKVRAALGPTGERAIHLVEEITQVALADIERLVMGWQVASDGQWQVTLVVHANESIIRQAFAGPAGAVEKQYGGQAYRLVNDRAYYLPTSRDGNVLVVSPAGAIADIIELGGEAPPLRRDVERLLAHTDADADRHVTIVVTPNSLFSEGRRMFEGEMGRLREPLFWFLGDELSAAAVSLHWDDNFFFELIATPTLDTSPESAARILADRIGQMPDKLEDYVVGLDPQPYSRHVVARVPGMIRKLSAYTRSGFEPDHAVLRGYLPAVAGHNLLMAAELTLAERPRAAVMVAEATAPSDSPSLNAVPVRERLQRSTSLRFARDTLEAALEQLSQNAGVEIVIRGADLQADGITKNQSFGIDIENKPAEEILVEILRLANPDKTATGPGDERQKLVYVIASSGPDGAEQVVITTRAAAASRGDELPEVFRAAKP